jgi:hypothetical protein
MMKRLEKFTNFQENKTQTGPRAADLSFFDRFATKRCVTLSLAAG